jgi:hypothetical protein
MPRELTYRVESRQAGAPWRVLWSGPGESVAIEAARTLELMTRDIWPGTSIRVHPEVRVRSGGETVWPTTRGSSRRTALTLGLLALLLPAALMAQTPPATQVTVAAGVSFAPSLGYSRVAPRAELIVSRSGVWEWEAITSLDAGRKAWSGAGWSLGQAVDVVACPVGPIGIVLGLDGRWNNQGPAAKRALWLRSGVAWRRQGTTVKVVVRLAGWEWDDPDTRYLQIELKHRTPTWTLAVTEGLGTWRYATGIRDDHWGWFSQVLVGRRIR